MQEVFRLFGNGTIVDGYVDATGAEIDVDGIDEAQRSGRIEGDMAFDRAHEVDEARSVPGQLFGCDLVEARPRRADRHERQAVERHRELDLVGFTRRGPARVHHRFHDADARCEGAGGEQRRETDRIGRSSPVSVLGHVGPGSARAIAPCAGCTMR